MRHRWWWAILVCLFSGPCATTAPAFSDETPEIPEVETSTPTWRLSPRESGLLLMLNDAQDAAEIAIAERDACLGSKRDLQWQVSACDALKASTAETDAKPPEDALHLPMWLAIGGGAALAALAAGVALGVCRLAHCAQ